MVRDPHQPTQIISGHKDVAELLQGYFKNHDREEFVVVCLDQKHKVSVINSVSTGSLSETLVHPREVFKAAILANSAAIIIAHNHPSGDTTPSAEDKILTTRLREAGKILGIELLDHIIIGDPGTTFSFVEMGLTT